jgi:hypothetical protein
MIFKVNAATDAASLILFDPQSLPEDWDQRWTQGDAIDELAALDADGRLFWINTDGDGDYSLHAFLNEPMPAHLVEFVAESRDANRFQVSSGQVHFAGAEYVFRDDNSALQRYPRMGGVFSVSNGSYHATLSEMAYPESLIEERFKTSTTGSQAMAYRAYNGLMPCAIVLTFAAVAGLATINSVVGRTLLASFATLLMVGAFGVRRLHAYQSAMQVRNDLEGECPDWIVVLRPIESSP